MSKAKEKNTSAEAIVKFLKDEIKFGRLVPGQRLAEIDITQATGATRAKVRVALQSLAVEGLVTIEPYRGASVRRVSLDELKQLSQVREVLEGIAARGAAERASAEALRKIRKLQAEMDQCVEKSDIAKFAALNDEWHRTIINESGNNYVLEFLDRLLIPIFRSMVRVLNRGDTIALSNRDHSKVTEAILAKDPAKAEKCMRKHIAHAFSSLEEESAAEGSSL